MIIWSGRVEYPLYDDAKKLRSFRFVLNESSGDKKGYNVDCNVSPSYNKDLPYVKGEDIITIIGQIKSTGRLLEDPDVSVLGYLEGVFRDQFP